MGINLGEKCGELWIEQFTKEQSWRKYEWGMSMALTFKDNLPCKLRVMARIEYKLELFFNIREKSLIYNVVSLSLTICGLFPNNKGKCNFKIGNNYWFRKDKYKIYWILEQNNFKF